MALTDHESRYRHRALGYYEDSTNEKGNTWYFFCIAGLNFTGKLLEDLDAFDSVILEHFDTFKR